MASRITAALASLCALMVFAGVIWPDDPGPDVEYAAMAAPQTPTRISAPAIGLSAKVVPIEVSAEAVLDPPANTSQVGWWRSSARPGQQRGQVVLTGHTVHSGGGVMNRLGRLRPGNKVRLGTTGRPMTYEVTRRMVWSRPELAQRAPSVFAQDRRRGRLVLVTCTGWRNGVYTRNIVVVARPLGVEVPA